METIDQLRINFSPEALKILNGVLALLMFSIALDIRIDDFRQLARQPKPALVGLLSEYLYLPIVTLALVYIVEPAASIALGMVLLAVCPGGSTSNYATYLARGNTALSVMLTSVTTLGAAVITPFAFDLWQRFLPARVRSEIQLSIDFADMALTVFFLVIVPVIIGVGLNELRPSWADRLRKPFKILSGLIFIGFVALAVAGNLPQISQYLGVIFGLTAAHNGLALLGGFAVATLFGVSRSNRRTITLETGLQNSGLGMTLVFTFFDGLGGMAIVLAWWGIWHLITGFTLAYLWGRRPIGELVVEGPRVRETGEDA